MRKWLRCKKNNIINVIKGLFPIYLFFCILVWIIGNAVSCGIDGDKGFSLIDLFVVQYKFIINLRIW